MDKIILDIKNADYWKIGISNKIVKDLTEKIIALDYSKPICNLLSDLVIIIREIVKYKEDFKVINIGHLSRLIKKKQNDLTTYKTEGSIYQIIRDFLVFLEENFPDSKLDRESTTYDPSILGEIREKQIVYTYQKLQIMAGERNGKLNTTLEEYNQLIKNKKPSSVKFTWTCDNPRHEFFESTPNNIMEGSWCPECFKEHQKAWQISRVGYSYEYLQQEAKKRGGELVTSKEKYLKLIEKVKPSRALVEWWCGNKDHEPWVARPHDIIIGNKWCPECSEGKYERRAREIFKKIFRKEFRKKNLNNVLIWTDLEGEESRFIDIIENLLKFGHFDGYDILNSIIGEIKVAFEYNGPQHYYWEYLKNRYGYSDKEANEHFNRIRERDELKRILAKKNKICLIEVPFYISERMDEFEKIRIFIESEFKELTGYFIYEIM